MTYGSSHRVLEIPDVFAILFVKSKEITFSSMQYSAEKEVKRKQITTYCPGLF